MRQVYESLRAGPGWNKTMLLISYDDAGGFFDQIIPPYVGVPADEAPCHKHFLHPNCTKPPFGTPPCSTCEACAWW